MKDMHLASFFTRGDALNNFDKFYQPTPDWRLSMTKTMIFAAALLIAAGFSTSASAQCCGGIPAPESRSVILSSGEQPAAEAQAAPASEDAQAAADQQAAPEAIAPASGEAQPAPAAVEGTEAPAAEAEAPAAATGEAQQPE